MITIIKDYIADGQLNRPMTNPNSSLYKTTARHKWLTFHEPWSTAKAKRLHAYLLSNRAAERPVSWHFTVDESDILLGLPLSESGWHAGDGMGPGNTQSIGKEVCDYAMRRDKKDEDLFWQSITHAAMLDAHLCNNIDSLLKYPDCLKPFPEHQKQHFHWSGKNCPAILRGLPSGWDKYIEMVGEYITIYKRKPINIDDIKENEYYLLMSGSYINKANAVKKKGELNEAGFPATISQVYVSGELYNRVVVGTYEYNQQDKLLNIIKDLQNKGFTTTILELEKEIFVDTRDIEPEEQVGEYNDTKDPDLDREHVEEHPEDYEDKKYSLAWKIRSMLLKLYEYIVKHVNSRVNK